MFLSLKHRELDIYGMVRRLVMECYKVTRSFPPDERFNMVIQIRRAAVSIQLNVAEGASRKSLTERTRFFEIARGSLVEIDAALDLAEDLHYCSKENLQELGIFITKSFSMLSKLINQKPPT